MYFKKLKLIVPFVLISFTVSTLLSVFILPSPNIKRNEYRVYKDSLGNTFYEELKNHEGKYVLLEQINPKTIDIFLAVEDQNFYTHLGIDGTRIFKALYDNLLKGRITQGASTITQQLAKNNYLDNEQNYIRKLREIFLSFIIENNYTKDDILEAYFNSIYFGHGIYGIENASLFFFGIPSFELNIPQSAMLVGIINAPNLYSPFIDKEKSIDKFHGILNYLYKNKTINSSEYEEYFNYEFNYTFNNNLTLSSSKLFYINGVKKELKKLGLDKENDLIINTYFDPFSNQVIDSIINSIPIKENTNLSVVIMKPFSNKIIALLGGKNYHNSSFNCAIDSSRQIGSTIKPFLYYLGLKSGMTLLTKLNSSPSTFFIQDYGFYEPKNFNSLYAYQDINMLEAIAYSDNIYAVKTGLLVGSKTVKNFFNYFNLEYEETPSSFLGSISLSLLELCDLYNCLASEGKYYSYSFIDSIYKSDGTLLYKNTNQTNLAKMKLLF